MCHYEKFVSSLGRDRFQRGRVFGRDRRSAFAPTTVSLADAVGGLGRLSANMAETLAAQPYSRRPLAWLRGRFRASEVWFIGLAILIGGAAGVLAVVQSDLAHGLQAWLYGFSFDDRLSALPSVDPWSLLWLPAGGVVLGATTWAIGRWRARHLVDVVEANALHGGELSLIDSVLVCVQTLISNGFGASVGLEAAYAQAGGGAASAIGRWLRLRRQDLRALVGAGSGAAIGAAFGAPLAGAFYAFEVVIGTYTPSMIAPVAAACLTSVMTARMIGATPYSIEISVIQPPDAAGYFLYSILGVVCAVAGIVLMRLVALAEALLRRTRLPIWARPAIGGAGIAGLALLSPQVLSSGHGALHADLAVGLGLTVLAGIFVLKAMSSVISLSFGFRGGLFFASLFLGSLLGQMYADLAFMSALPVVLQREDAALVGMGAMAVAVVGGPLTMSFLVLETTRDFGVAAATLAASLIASTIVRERFGYSLSTWRMHLRGETIRSARDVGWVRALSAVRLMRSDVPIASAAMPLGEFVESYPLGSHTRVLLRDVDNRYAGIVLVATAHRETSDAEGFVAGLAINAETTLRPDMNIAEVMVAFDAAEAEELAVVDSKGNILGVVSQLYVARRYARELEHNQQRLFGEV